MLVHASLFERAPASDGTDDGLGFNTAVLVAPSGEVVARTRKTHIPVTAGYYEDKYFRQGPPDDAYPVYDLADPALRLGMPTCWDEWFPEVARAYGLAGAQVLVYPTAIGSEPRPPRLRHPAAVAAHHRRARHRQRAVRRGAQPLRHRGADHLLRVLVHRRPLRPCAVRAPRDEAAVLVADLDLAQGRDWIGLVPFLLTRRPYSYASLTAPVRPEHQREG